MRGRGRTWIVCALALAGGALATMRVQAAVRADEGIPTAVAGMREALQRGDARTLASFYTEEADLAGPVSAKGRAAIEQHMANIIRQGIRDVKLEGRETYPGADYTAETGRASFYDRTGARVTVLSYMTLWKKSGAGWKIHRDVSFPVAVDAAAVVRMVAADGGFSIRETEAFHAVLLPMTGSYGQHNDAIGKLAAWLESAGVRPLGGPFGRYENSAAEVGEDALRWEVGFPVPEGTQAPAPFEVRQIADGAVATAVIGGPHDKGERPWPQMLEWAEKNGYEVTGPAMELWLDGPRTEMRIAVRK